MQWTEFDCDMPWWNCPWMDGYECLKNVCAESKIQIWDITTA